MCGLCGLLTANHNAAEYVDALEQSLQCMRHRGPDAAGTWHDEDAAFGFNRLSIIDLEHSHQPLRWGPEDNPERYALTFNGEIYNYIELREELSAAGLKFNTEGDGEPIVVGYHHWGEDVVNHLRGMFGFVIWDTETKTMFAARDQFGIKPLYYATTDAGTIFASEMKCILEMAEPLGLDLSLDKRAIEHYIDLQYVPEPESLHSNIRRVESGSTVTLKPGQKVVNDRYFKPRFPVQKVAQGQEQQLFDKIAKALEDSVEKHMRADVTVGSFLSGGIDSTAIATLAKRHNPDLLTFTTGFEREGYSEVDVAAESAAAIGVEHIVKIVSPRNTPPRSRRSCGTSTIQSRTLLWSRCTSWRRKPASTSRWFFLARAPTSSSAVTPFIRSRFPWHLSKDPIPTAPRSRPAFQGTSRGHEGEVAAQPWFYDHGGALLRQRPLLQLRADAARHPMGQGRMGSPRGDRTYLRAVP